MVELRKRKTVAEAAPPPAPKRSASSVKKAVEPTKKPTPDAPAKSSNPSGKVATGVTISLDGFGGEVETHSGEKTNLKKLVNDSKTGVVLFTYPKASTPGCTTQACLFRDNYAAITDSGLSVYGLSTDAPKSNTSFASKQSLPYPLLCDPSATLISAIGMKKAPKGTARGAVVIDKTGKIVAWEQGGPQRTVDIVMGVLQKDEISNGDKQNENSSEQVKVADTAAEVADTAAKIDKDVSLGSSI